MSLRSRSVRLVAGTRQYPLLPGDWLIGRSAQAGLAITDALASREHAVVRVGVEAVVVEDLGSRNGTFVNDRRVDEPTALLPGDLLRIGDTVFTLEVEEVETSWVEPAKPVKIAPGGREVGERTHAPAPADTLPAASRGARQRAMETSQIIEPRTAVLVLGDREWAEQIRRAAIIHPNLSVRLADAALAAENVRDVPRGVLLLDLAAAGPHRASIQGAWAAPQPRGPVLVVSGEPEAEGAALARQLGASGYVKRGKSAILVVAQLRYHLQRADAEADAEAG